MKKYKLGILLMFMVLAVMTKPYAQDLPAGSVGGGDSIDLGYVVGRVIQSYPAIQKAMEAINIADHNINLAHSAYYPEISASATYSRVGPIPSFEVPNIGEIKLFPDNNYSASLSYHQNLYDFGRSATKVELAKENRKMAESGWNLTKQMLALNTIRLYYSLVYLQDAIVIREQQSADLNELVEYTRKKYNTGSSTDFDLLNTRVRLSANESMITELKSARTSRLSELSSLLDSLLTDTSLFSKHLNVGQPVESKTELIDEALDNREEIRNAREKLAASRIRYRNVKTLNNPLLGAFASAGEKNGYVPEIDKIKFNYAAGITLNIPVYNGNREKENLAIAQSGIQAAQYDLDLAKRKITNEVVENYSDMEASLDKINRYQMQAGLAEKAYDLAKVNYKAGAITNLDLLTAETSLSESRLLLLKARIDFTVTIYRLRASVGEKLYE